MEVAAGVVVAEQVISTTIEGGAIAAYAISKPTMPLTATFTRIITSPDVSSPDSLQRSSHTLNVVNGKAFVFGGEVSKEKLAGNEIHIFTLPGASPPNPDYQCAPAIAADGTHVPCPRSGHTACAVKTRIYVFGGRSEDDAIGENGCVWVFDTQTLQWSLVEKEHSLSPASRYNHAAVVHGDNMVIHGGLRSNETSAPPLTDTWSFNTTTTTWIPLPQLPVANATVPPSLGISEDTLYLISGNSELESQINSLSLTEPSAGWQSKSFPTNPMTPGPRPREGAGVVCISTGYGRQYLLYMFGKKMHTAEKQQEDVEYWSGMWTYQLPSSKNIMPAAAIKDEVRKRVGADSGEGSWAEVEILPPDMESASEGKIHPGPRGYFATAKVDMKNVLLYGGINAKGETEGDGWLISLK